MHISRPSRFRQRITKWWVICVTFISFVGAGLAFLQISGERLAYVVTILPDSVRSKFGIDDNTEIDRVLSYLFTNTFFDMSVLERFFGKPILQGKSGMRSDRLSVKLFDNENGIIYIVHSDKGLVAVAYMPRKLTNLLKHELKKAKFPETSTILNIIRSHRFLSGSWASYNGNINVLMMSDAKIYDSPSIAFYVFDNEFDGCFDEGTWIKMKQMKCKNENNTGHFAAIARIHQPKELGSSYYYGGVEQLLCAEDLMLWDAYNLRSFLREARLRKKN